MKCSVCNKALSTPAFYAECSHIFCTFEIEVLLDLHEFIVDV